MKNSVFGEMKSIPRETIVAISCTRINPSEKCTNFTFSLFSALFGRTIRIYAYFEYFDLFFDTLNQPTQIYYRKIAIVDSLVPSDQKCKVNFPPFLIPLCSSIPYIHIYKSIELTYMYVYGDSYVANEYILCLANYVHLPNNSNIMPT